MMKSSWIYKKIMYVCVLITVTILDLFKDFVRLNIKELFRKIVLMIASNCFFRNRRFLCNDHAVILCLLFCLSFTISALLNIPDSMMYLFPKQLAVFPQEKIYLHTDKSVYITCERMCGSALT